MYLNNILITFTYNYFSTVLCHNEEQKIDVFDHVLSGRQGGRGHVRSITAKWAWRNMLNYGRCRPVMELYDRTCLNLLLSNACKK